MANVYELAVLEAAKNWAYKSSNPHTTPLDRPEERALYLAVARLRAHEERPLAARLGAGVMVGGEPADAILDTERLYDDE